MNGVSYTGWTALYLYTPVTNVTPELPVEAPSAASEPKTDVSYYTSTMDVRLRAEPSSLTGSRTLTMIPAGTVIEVSEVYYGWGKTTCVIGGVSYTGWTALYLYTPVTSPHTNTPSVEVPAVVTGTRADVYSYLVYTLGFTAENARAILSYLDDAYQNAPAVTPSSPVVYPVSVAASQTQMTIYDFLVNDLGFNRAVACAVMVNLEMESGFSPNASCIDTNNKISYGLCQWNAERYTALIDFCDTGGYAHNSLEAQLQYLEYELKSIKYRWIYLQLLACDDSAEGCSNASYLWASDFEVCSSNQWSKRAEKAYQYYLAN